MQVNREQTGGAGSQDRPPSFSRVCQRASVALAFPAFGPASADIGIGQTCDLPLSREDNRPIMYRYRSCSLVIQNRISNFYDFRWTEPNRLLHASVSGDLPSACEDALVSLGP